MTNVDLFPKPLNDLICQDDAHQLDERVDQMITCFKSSEVELTKLVLESTSLSTASESRARVLLEQGLCKRLLGFITGTNQKLRNLNERDLAHGQYMAQKTMVHLTEQNALTMNMVVAVRSQVNMVSQNINHLQKNVAELWTHVGQFAQAVADKLENIENRLDSIEHDNRLDCLSNTLKVTDFHGVRYSKLDDVSKIVCVANDFHVATRGNWRPVEDWKRFRGFLYDLGLDYEEDTIIPREFVRVVAKSPELMQKLFDDTGVELSALESPVYSPSLYGLRKMLDYNNGERYVTDTVLSAIPNECMTTEDIALNLSCNYITQATDASLTVPITIDDFCRSLLTGLQLMIPVQEANDTQEMIPNSEACSYVKSSDCEMITDIFDNLIEELISNLADTMNVTFLQEKNSTPFRILNYGKGNDLIIKGLFMNIAGISLISKFFKEYIYKDKEISDKEHEKNITMLFFSDYTFVSPVFKRFLDRINSLEKSSDNIIKKQLQNGGAKLLSAIIYRESNRFAFHTPFMRDMRALLNDKYSLGMILRYFSRNHEVSDLSSLFDTLNRLMGNGSLDENEVIYFNDIWKTHVEGWEDEVAEL